jgi:hypothetical protein
VAGLGDIERKLKKVREGAGIDYFELKDGSRCHFDPGRYGIELFLDGMAAMECDWEGRPRPPVPDLLKALCRAKDRRRTMDQMYPMWKTKQPQCGYDFAGIVAEGRLEPYPLVQGYPAQHPEEAD